MKPSKKSLNKKNSLIYSDKKQKIIVPTNHGGVEIALEDLQPEKFSKIKIILTSIFLIILIMFFTFLLLK